MKPHLIRLLNSKKRVVRKETIKLFRQRINELSQTVAEFYSMAPKPLVIPPIVHFAKKPPFVDIIKNMHTYSRPRAQNLAPQISGITASWRESADNCLLHLMPQTYKKGKGKKLSAHHLKLATSFFKCHWCQEPISYPGILKHGCLIATERMDNPDKDEGQHVDSDVNSIWDQMKFWYGTEWNERNNEITFDGEASGFAQAIVKACGKAPNKTTFDEMNHIDARVECLRCFKKGPNSKRLVMNWTRAVITFLHTI
jgi:hypothetical protein